LPESKVIRSTIPGTSALTVTPCTATTLPIARRLDSHSASRATIVATAVGGGRKDVDMAIADWT
jgi:hypothetical protein